MYVCTVQTQKGGYMLPKNGTGKVSNATNTEDFVQQLECFM